MDNKISKQTYGIINLVIAGLLKIDPKIESIVIFGSRINKIKADKNSDFDFAIFVNKNLPFNKLKLIGQTQKNICKNNNVKLSLHIFNIGSFDQWDKIRLYHISKNHKVVYGKDFIPKKFIKKEVLKAVRNSFWNSLRIIRLNILNINNTSKIFTSNDLSKKINYETIFTNRTTETALNVSKHSITHLLNYQNDFSEKIIDKKELEKYIIKIRKYKNKKHSLKECLKIQKFCLETLQKIEVKINEKI